jgi:hypothetical protein
VNVSEARDSLINAVRRDLYGPRDTDDPPWPGAVPKVITSATHFDAWREVSGVFVDEEGNEVLHGSPLRRYGVGILFPDGLSRRQEEQLDAVQADAAHEAADVEAKAGTPLEPPPSEEQLGSGHAEVEDAAEDAGVPWRPCSMAVSFLVRHDPKVRLQLEVAGGRYVPMGLAVAGEPVSFWRRQGVAVAVELTADHEGTVAHDVADGLIQLNIGAVNRRHEAGTIVTAFVVNRSPAGADLSAATSTSLFQARLTVTAPAGAILEYPTPEVLEGEERTLDLLYHRQAVRGVGHGCNARIEDCEDTTAVIGEHFPVELVRSPSPDAFDTDGKMLVVDMDQLGDWSQAARNDVEAILTAYAHWLAIQRRQVERLPAHLRGTADRHLDACQQFHDGAVEGWSLANSDVTVRQLLQWTSEAMANQRRAYAADIRPLELSNNRVARATGTSPHDPVGRSPARWRAFQIAFLLASLPGAAHASDPRRNAVDIIWMPTGGGKTEAYSAVAAFTMMWRRFHQVADGTKLGGQGSTVLMRYTLRLLTAQQLQRAAALICALEQIRRAHPEQLGAGRKFTIGAWLGRRSTPNDWSGARKGLSDWKSDPAKRAFLLTRCPWCAAAIGRRSGSGLQQVDGYKTVPVPNSSDTRVMAYCPDPACPFNDDNQRNSGERPSGLPVYEVDADLYTQAPTFVVGTVDKFAQLSWRTEPGRFFGLTAGRRTGAGPSLLIQDELHLISGPLGSLDALYEPVIEDLCVRQDGERPKIIAATATTRRYVEQTQALYGRSDTRLIPPPGLDAADNFFSRTNPNSAGKMFVGIFAPGFGKAQEAQIRLLAALGHAAGSLDPAAEPADPWWSNLCFFSSRRTLGLVESLCQTHLRGHLWRLHRATGVDAGPRRATGTRNVMRSMVARMELTAQATADVSEAMGRLAVAHDARGCADLCFATSMIEVGIDIDRLGLLTIFGQPKSASQYIQVAGRVGRDERGAPGVVFVVLSAYNSRDRSHFEQFSTFHRRLYASVEPVSITPFTPAALERGLAGAAG